MGNSQPLLTIAIPTWNRASFLECNLKQIYKELKSLESELVEVIVSDNFSTDHTELVVKNAKNAGFNLVYVRNAENIGSDANIAQSFNLAKGEYVLILGDDDLFIDGALLYLIGQLKFKRYGVVCMRPYGYDFDFREEYPGVGSKDRVFHEAGKFLGAIGPLMTLISSCVINKTKLDVINANQFCGENLVQVHLVIRAALASKENLFIKQYLIACKRNNSGGYDFSEVFVKNLGRILDSYVQMGLTRKAIISIENRLLVSYFPQYILKHRLNNSKNIGISYQNFLSRYRGRFCFYFWVAPILKLPRFLALIWGGMATLLGRAINGDINRGFKFLINKILKNVS